MASKRRGGFRPPELRGTLGTLLRTTTDVVRDALERGASAGRARLDDVRASRRRADTLAELGELVLDLIRRGEIDLAELPEARDLVRHLDELDAEGEPEDEGATIRPATRRRFDDRPAMEEGRGRRDSINSTIPVSNRARDRRPSSDGTVSAGARYHRDSDPRSALAHDEDDDGTVTSSAAALRATRPTTPARPRPPESPTSRAPTKPMKGPWRRTEPVAPIEDEEPSSGKPAYRPALAPDPHRKGGISFDDDDLNEYMHPDDVPPKGPPRDPDGTDS